MSIHSERTSKLFGLRAKIKTLSITGDIADVAFLQSRESMTAEQKNILDKELRLLRIHDRNINAAKQAQLQVLGRIDLISKTITQAE